MRHHHALLVGAIAGLMTAGTIVLPAGTAHAESKVTYTTGSGTALAAGSPTTLTVSGSGFQSIDGGFGGIYVFFGWVDDGWRPSQGGVTGKDYRYIPDSEAKNNKGYQRFVSFPDSETEQAANGGTIAADGTWSTDLTVPGATFTARDRDGDMTEVNCLEVTCGIITVGAHGVSNASNESFTPVEFTQADDTADNEDGSDNQDDGAGSSGDENDKGSEPAPGGKDTPKSTKPVASVDPATAVVGRVMSFTGHGFRPGEQVVVTLDDGIASVGPLTAGESGEIAGVLELPPQIEAGTHTIRMTGAASRAKPVKRFAIRVNADAAAMKPIDEEAETVPLWDSTPFRFLLAAGCVLIVAVAACVLALLRSRRARTRRTPSTTFGARAAGAEVQR